MDMNDGEDSMSMTPYLHFTSGDALWIESISPSSKGAVAGACIFLVALAIFERFYSGWQARLQESWTSKIQVLMKRPPPQTPTSTSSDEKVQDGSSVSSDFPAYERTLPPFVFKYDVPRGALFLGHSFLLYMLMLALMTYNAAYIISILIGLGIGEVAFGRYAQVPTNWV